MEVRGKKWGRKEEKEQGKKGNRKREAGKEGRWGGYTDRRKTQQMSYKNINKGDGCSSVKEEIMGVDDDDDDNDDSFV